MATLKEGMRVQVRARPLQDKEAQEGRYAPHLANATGTILKIYTPQEIAVDLDIESLPEAVRERHAEQQARMHERWLTSLSEEARNRLTEEEKTFRLRYVVLLSEADLQPLAEKRSKATTQSAAATSTEATTGKPQSRAPKASEPQPPESVPRRPTPEELDQLEAQYLQSRAKRRR